MKYKRVGDTDLKVSALGFGCAPIGSRAGILQSQRVLRAAYEQGINYFDTADMYGVGASEQILGRVFKHARDKIVISTKCGYEFSSRLKALRWIKPLIRPLMKRLSGVKSSAASFVASQTSRNFEPAYIQQSIHNSLRRLRTDHIDLFFLHDPPAAIAERGDAFEQLQTMKQAGKIRYYGVSCDLEVVLKLLEHSDFGISAVQVSINLMQQKALESLFPIVRRTGLGVIARQPFEHGELFQKLGAMTMLEQFGLLSGPEYVSKLALRFLSSWSEISSILPSMMQSRHLQANVAAIDSEPLSAKEKEFIQTLRVRLERESAC